MSDDPLTDCPECGEEGLRKLVSAAAFRLKGGGWYETDFKGDKDRQLNLSKSDDKPADKESKKEDKPAAGADTGKSDGKAGDEKPRSVADKKTAKEADSQGPSRSASTGTAS